MSCVCVIPARLHATRFPEKVLAKLGSKTILQHTWEQACKATQIDKVLIACDHLEIYDAASAFGAQVVMTSENHKTGSDRIAEAVKNLSHEIIINLQADEPEIDPSLLDQLVTCLTEHKAADCATVISDLFDLKDIQNKNCVKAVIDRFGRALYFSRSFKYGYRHMGVYAYRRSALFRFLDMPRGTWEQAEDLEQLRLLEAGMSIQTVWTKYAGISIDTPEDLERLKAKKHHV
ncbi:MAG: 3-deoxy-manno-octulosonate cytidylyltransferase [Myxococcaceae bacterium]